MCSICVMSLYCLSLFPCNCLACHCFAFCSIQCEQHDCKQPNVNANKCSPMLPNALKGVTIFRWFTHTLRAPPLGYVNCSMLGAILKQCVTYCVRRGNPGLCFASHGLPQYRLKGLEGTCLYVNPDYIANQQRSVLCVPHILNSTESYLLLVVVICELKVFFCFWISQDE